MANLYVKTDLDSVVIVGQFCNWDVDKSIRIDKKKGSKRISVESMPIGEYRILSCKSYIGGEIYPTDGRDMCNRYFGGDSDETISVYFSKSN